MRLPKMWKQLEYLMFQKRWHLSKGRCFYYAYFQGVSEYMAFVFRFGWTKDNMEDMPKPKAEGLKISREKIWGANAKRSASALFSGKLKNKS